MGGRELSLELLAPICQAQARLLPQRPWCDEPVDLMLFEEAETPPLARISLHRLRELLQKWQPLVCEGLEVLQVQPPDLRGGDAVDLAQRLVRHILLAGRRGYQATELQPYQVLDLLLRYLLDHPCLFIISGDSCYCND